MVAMQENEYTSTVYNLIKEGRYSAAVEQLEPVLQVRIDTTKLLCYRQT